MTATIASLLLLAGLTAPAFPPEPPIFGGEPAPPCTWPSAVSLNGCSGTLIHPEVVVYAAHCGDVIPQVWFGEIAFAGEGRAVATDFCMVNPLFELGMGNDFAFCRLAEPVTDIPFTPPLMGCETTLLTPGREIALVGFGAHDIDGNAGVKYQLTTTLNFITEDNEAQTGDNTGYGVCFGDSGGPAYIKLDESVGGDGSWRAFGIASYITGGCGAIGQHVLIHEGIEWIEENSGVDVTPCHYPGGAWDPTADCKGFAIDIDESNGTWDDACSGGEKTDYGASCGPAHVDADDLTAPTTRILTPKWGRVFDSDPDSGTATFSVTAEASDDVSGVVSVGLSVNGNLPDEAIDYDPPWEWPLVTLSSGVYTLRVVARDHSGKEAESDPVMIGVDMEPPEMPDPPDPASSTGEDESSSTAVDPSTSTSTGPDATTGTIEPAEDSEPTSGEPTPIDDDSGCGCRADHGRGALFLLLVPLLAATRRRRGVA